MFQIKSHSAVPTVSYEEEIKKEMQEAFYQLGENCYKEYGENIEEAPDNLHELLSQIKELDKKLQHQNQRNNSQMNLRKCPSCGAYISSEAAFCTMCGSKMPVEEEKRDSDTKQYCPYCNAKIDKSARFCTNCGYKIEVESDIEIMKELEEISIPDVEIDMDKITVPEIEIEEDEIATPEIEIEEDEIITPQPVTKSEKAIEPKKEEKDAPLFCVECGNKLRPGVRFCTNCGRRIK